MSFQITGKEVRSTIRSVLLSTFLFFGVIELREIILQMFPNINPLMVSVIGVIGVLFFFKV